ncbi:MAG: molybdopterin adenylyltransferase [Campylobacter lanienae]|uniref:Molybdopterin adenylyltransferase n=1 Tax=Campylobacter lanienae TaxID=75658 RepID=A0ABY3G9I6_9BACT|nr:molybdopterin adenylyltransferase [Campylobacter lanienae]MDD5786770.1 molybdopterin adenylyltransferase [Campylobacter lanienae]MDY3132510.1 molybdopterin adenylyltransferase [Campylobacter lanienae]MDY6056330.1 molybdopterin adenylyltransferase [Campylobacter lanienae]TWO15392.1 molybdopterin adenylyltransferase [Campylobacter lanienae]TWO30166.1 molybdopterin adenylyltransferase [Campylobacter lanienae]
MVIKIGVLTLSDRASAGVYADESGIAIQNILKEWIIGEINFTYRVIPDEYDLITANLIQMCEIGCDIIFTTGGTGPALRDVTPEATEKVCQKMLPGFGELMRSVSLKYVPTAILSRQSAGIRDKSLIVNLPGQPKAIKECLEPIFPAIPYCLDLIGASYIECDESKIKVFRPKKK